MVDLKINSNNDLDVSNGDIQLVSDGLEVVQSAKIRILIIQGEWWLDLLIGVPWFDMMFRTVYSLRQKTDYLRRVILDTIGVRRILKFEFGMNLINRGSLIELNVETDFGIVSGEVKI